MTPQTDTHAAITVAGITYPMAPPPDPARPGESVTAKGPPAAGPAFDPTNEEEDLLVECGRLWIRSRLPADRDVPKSARGPSFVRIDATALLGLAASATTAD